MEINRKLNKKSADTEIKANFAVLEPLRYFDQRELIHTLNATIVRFKGKDDNICSLKLIPFPPKALKITDHFRSNISAEIELPSKFYEELRKSYELDLIHEFSVSIEIKEFDGLYYSSDDCALLWDESLLDENASEFAGSYKSAEYVFSQCKRNDEAQETNCHGGINRVRFKGVSRALK